MYKLIDNTTHKIIAQERNTNLLAIKIWDMIKYDKINQKCVNWFSKACTKQGADVWMIDKRIALQNMIDSGLYTILCGEIAIINVLSDRDSILHANKYLINKREVK